MIMSGPIVRTAPTPAFSENWERVFGKKKAASQTKKKVTAKSAKKKKPAKSKKK